MPILCGLFAEWSGLPRSERFDGWHMAPFERDGQVQAIAAVSGCEIHFAVNPAFRHRVIARHRTREFLAPIFAKFNMLTTSALPESNADRFLTRLGFEKTWNDGAVDHYMMTALPFGKDL